MILSVLGAFVHEGHLNEGKGGRIAVLQALEEGASESVARFLGYGADLLPIPLDDEMRQPALEIRPRFPSQDVALDFQMGRSRRRRLVHYLGILDELHPLPGRLGIRKPHGFLFVSRKLRSRHGLLSEQRSQPGLVRRHGLEGGSRLGRQAGLQAGVQPGYRHIARVSAFVSGQRINGEPEQPSFGPDFQNEFLVGRPDPGEPSGFQSYAFLGTRVAHDGNAEGFLGKVMGLDRWAIGVLFEQRHA